MAYSVFPPASTGAVNKVYKEQYFKADGTWTYPTSSNFNGEVEVTVVGAGGGSGTSVNRGPISNNFAFIGAGGGGQVLSKYKFSVLDLGNQTVKIGLGGGASVYSGGLFGGYSSFGNADAANIYTDPSLANGLLVGGNSAPAPEYFDTYNNSQFQQNHNMASSTTWLSGTNPPLPPVGNTFVTVSTTSSYPATGEYFTVEPSTSYKIGASYHRNSVTGVIVTPRVNWYTEDGVYISQSTLTAYTTLSTSGTWDEVVSTVSSPSTARYGRINWAPTGAGSSFRITGVFVTKTSSGITTVKSGYSSGYKWTGQPNASFTVAENANLVIAQGGGGGWGIGAVVSDDGARYPIPGQAGYTSGGKPIYFGSTTINAYDHLFSGNGGGAGGSAIPPKVQSSIAGTTNSVISHESSGSYTATDNPYSYYRWWNTVRDASVSGGSGSYSSYIKSSVTTGLLTSYPFEHHGGPGEGIDGYGIGGFGYFASATGAASRTLNPVGSKQYIITRENVINSTAADKAYYNAGVANTGNGANGFKSQLSSGANIAGNRGGSGIVIVRWYE